MRQGFGIFKGGLSDYFKKTKAGGGLSSLFLLHVAVLTSLCCPNETFLKENMKGGTFFVIFSKLICQQYQKYCYMLDQSFVV